MRDVIDAVGVALLRRLLEDLEAGRVVLTRCDVGDDADGEHATLAWGPPGNAAAVQDSRPKIMPNVTIGVDAGDSSHDHTICGTCRQAAEVIPEDNGGGFYCAACDRSWD